MGVTIVPIWSAFPRLVLGFRQFGVAPFLKGAQTWKLSQWRFIKNDEKQGEDIPYLSIHSISYRHPFVKQYHFLPLFLVFHIELDSDMLKMNVFAFDCNIF